MSSQEKVKFLSSGSAYPDRPSRVDVIETHMSWVFLAGDSVYKLKKPVKYPFLDFSVLAAREFDCREEFRLNQRLAPGVYLGVVALTLEERDRLALNGPGPVVDWLVLMHRLPAERMLDKLIERGAVSQTDIGKVAELLAGFYRQAPSTNLTPEDYVTGFVHEQAENISVVGLPRFELPRSGMTSVFRAIEGFLEHEAETLKNRVREHRVIEGHGDLRPEHVCILEPPAVIDCLEFNTRLRLVDPFDELALLGMDCERLGADWIGRLLIERCARALDDPPPARLMDFYTAFRATLRARLMLAHLLEPDPRRAQRWVPLAKQYLAIAERASIRLLPRQG